MTSETFQPEIKKAQERPRTPLLHFKGKLDSAEGVVTTYNDGNKGQRVSFKFTNLEVIEASEPYPFEVGEILVNYGMNTKTPWSAFVDSVVAVTGQELPFSDLVGKHQEWHWLPATIRRPDENNVWADRDSMAWQLVWLEGYESGDAPKIMDLIIDMADGKTLTEFNTAFLGETSFSTLAGYKDAMSAVMERDILNNLVAAGKLNLNGETYSKV